MTDRRTDGRTDRRTGKNNMSPDPYGGRHNFHLEVGDKSEKSKKFNIYINVSNPYLWIQTFSCIFTQHRTCYRVV